MAFFEYFVDVLNHSYRCVNAAPLDGLSLPSCTYCRDTAQDLKGASIQGDHYSGGLIKVTSVVAASGNPSQGLLVSAVVEQEAGARVAKNGATITAYPQHTRLRIDAGVRWQEGKWRIVEVSVGG